MANAWGELSWSIGNYGEQNNVDVFVTGASSSSSIGQITVETQQILDVPGLSLSANLGEPQINLLNNGWGAATWGFSSWGQKGTVIPDTNLATTSIGSVTATAGAIAFPDSILLQTVNDSPNVRIDNEALVTGIQSQFTVGDASPAADANTGFFGSATAQTSNGVVEVNGEIQIGWGGDTWGENEWGDLSGAIPDIQGISATTSIASVTTQASANIDVTGIELQTSFPGVVAGTSALINQEGMQLQILTGNEEVNFVYDATGSQLSTNTGQAVIDDEFLIGEGWGRDTFGNLGWGVNYSAIGGGVNGLGLTSTIGNEDAFTDFTIQVDGFGLSTAISPVDTQADGNASVNVEEEALVSSLGDLQITGTGNLDLTGLSMSSAIGIAEGFLLLEVPVTGIQLSTNIGNEDTAGNADVIPTGLSITTTLGNAITGIGVPVTGIQAQGSVGEVVVEGQAEVPVTGVSLTVSLGSPNIVAWQEVDTGTPVIWSEVDLAA